MSDAPLPPLSPSQQAAVEHPFEDALVTAGAGSGKTRVLSERFVHLVREGHVPLRRLAALTFTEKAAAQMRHRIAELFRRLGDEDRYADVEFAPISTIHAFCALLLRQHAIEAGVDPAFRVLDAIEAELLLDDAAERAESRLAATRPDLLDDYALLAGDARPALLELLEQLRGAGCDLADVQWRDGGLDLLAAVAAVQEARGPFVAIGELLPEARRPAHTEALARIDDALANCRLRDEELVPFLAAGALTAVGGLKGPRKHAYTKPHKAMRVALEQLTGALLDRWGARLLLPQLREILGLYATAYAELKEEQAALDFTDLELRAREVLRRVAAEGRTLDLVPSGLLVDEFQDTNPLQDEILSALRRHAPQFSVGDPKQSIYRFRGADVEVMLRESDRLGASGQHAMNTSYRACPELVAGVNALNERLFEDGAAGVPYDGLEAAAPYLPTTSFPRQAPPLEVAIVDGTDESNTDRARELEAAWIAARIEALTDGSELRLRADPATGKSVGPVRLGDIAILARVRGALPAYEAALEARGIPFLTQSSTGFFLADEIRDLIDVLRVVHNPGDVHALACAATGPAMGAGERELLRWFGPEPGRTAARPPWERIVEEAAAGGRFADVVRTLQAIREEAVTGSLARAVEMALRDLGLLEAALLSPGGDRRAANLRKAVEFARRLDAGGRRGLGDLLRHLETLREREMGEPDAPVGGEADDVVRLATVHSAKGLEYPVVFVADIGRGPRGNAPVIHFDGARDVAAKVADPLEGVACVPAGYRMIAALDKAESAEEELRLLYVATTRAEERLVLSGACTGTTKSNGQPKYLRGWGKQLWTALDLPFEYGVSDIELDVSGGGATANVRVHVVDGTALDVPVPPEPHRTVAAADAESRAEAEVVLTRAAEPVAPLGDTRYVVSVSELLTFAASPQRYYEERVLRAAARDAATAAWDAPVGGDGAEADETGGTSEAGRRRERAARWDEYEPSGETPEAIDRAALGRVVHAVIERLGADDEVPPPEVIGALVAEEGGDEAMVAAATGMVARFLASPLGVRMRAALAAGVDVRREVDFHARIRFPGGETVAGFDSLLVKGSIDLWLPTDEGILVVDHKTNRAGSLFDAPEALADFYGWQLRLYALAAERLLGADVAGAVLLLLDPGWGAEALEVPVEVTGEVLEETRRLCRAFAIAEQAGRYPQRWRQLLD